MCKKLENAKDADENGLEQQQELNDTNLWSKFWQDRFGVLAGLTSVINNALSEAERAVATDCLGRIVRVDGCGEGWGKKTAAAQPGLIAALIRIINMASLETEVGPQSLRMAKEVIETIAEVVS